MKKPLWEQVRRLHPEEKPLNKTKHCDHSIEYACRYCLHASGLKYEPDKNDCECNRCKPCKE